MAWTNAQKILEYRNNHTDTVNGTTTGRNTFILARDVPNGETLAAASNIYDIGGTNIEINLGGANIRVEETGTSDFKPLIIASSKSKKSTRTPQRKIIDRKKVEHIFTIRGWLSDDAGDITNTSIANTTLNKKNAILAFQEASMPIRFYYRTEAFIVTIKQALFTDTDTENTTGDLATQIAKLEYIIQLWVGKEK